MARTKQLYEDNGVELSKATISVGDEVTLVYRGLLAKSGADSVYAHIGYGENWDGKELIPMEKMEDVFKATIKVNLSDKLNIAFKDSVDNWDNNSQQNYSFSVSQKSSGVSPEKKTSSIVKASVAKSDVAKEASETKSKAAKTKSTTSTKAATSTKTAAKKTTTADKTITAKKSTTAKSAAKKTNK